MTNKVLTLIVGAVAIAAAGVMFWRLNISIEPDSSQATQPQQAPAPPAQSDLNKKREEGIGSINELKPVPLDSNPEKSNPKR
jgi:hypothetical protein